MAKTLGSVVHFVVFSNIYLSFGASAVAWVTIFVAGLPFDLALVFIPFAGGMFIYNLNRQTDMKEDVINVPDRVKFFERYGKYLVGASFIMYIAALYLSLLGGLPAFFVSLLPGILASFYSVKRLKRVYFFKNVLVGLSWGVTPILVGFYNSVMSPEIVALSAFFSVAFFVNTVIFDLKDTIGDSSARIKTIPIELGPEKTRTVCYLSILTATAILAASILLGFAHVRSLVLFPFIAYIFLYVRAAGPKKGGLFYGAVVDGEFVFLFLILLVPTILGL